MSTRGIWKYYVGLVLLMALSIGLLIYTIAQSSNAKVDALTNKAVEQIGNKLDSYIIDSGNVPSSLAQAGITDVPTTVAYTQLSQTKYKVCFDYKAASSGFDGGALSLLGGAISSGLSTSSSGGNSQNFNPLVEFSHKKGQNCQTVDASQNVDANSLDQGNNSVNSNFAPNTISD